MPRAGRQIPMGIAIVVAILVLGAILINRSSAPDETSASEGPGKVGGTVVQGIAEEPDTLDPHKTNAAVTGLILRYAGDTLVTKDPEGNYTPGLATDWQVSEDGKRWTFRLRDGVTFQDGSPVDAQAVKASIERALDPKTEAGLVASLFSEVKRVEAPSDNTVVVEMSKPFAVFLDNITDPRAAIVNAEAVDQMGTQFGRKPVLTGPWQVTDYVSGESISLTRNPDYEWGPDYVHDGPAYIETLEFRIIPDSATMVSALQAGDVQIVDTLPPAQVDQFEGDDQYELHSFLRKGVGLFLEFNVTEPPFDDPRVREALNYAIDKGELVEVALRGLGEEACGALPPSIDGYWEGICDYAPGHDPARAQQLLKRAGYNEGSNGMLEKDGQPFSFTLHNTPIDTWTQSAQLVQQQLRDVGIDMKIQNFEFGTLLSRLQAGDQQAHFMGYTYTTPDILFLWFHSSNIGNGLNLSHIEDPKLDALLEESRAEVEREDRMQIYQDIQKYLVDEEVWVPLWTNEDVSATRAEIAGEKISNEGYLVLLDAYLNEQ